VELTPDQTVLWQYGVFKINLTIATTWALMFVLVVGSRWVTRALSTDATISRWQNLLEIIVDNVRGQIRDVGLAHAETYLPFIGTLFLFIALSNVCTIIPGYEPPTGSLSTTAALALTVFVAVPAFGIAGGGARAYLKSYLEPTPLMLPFNVISELSRTLALAVRLFGNIMSGTMILAILISVVPLVFPIFMTALGLLTGLVQAYIFAVLATVYIAAAARSRSE
jgi:F-type H+-transporting ATPase subunit a